MTYDEGFAAGMRRAAEIVADAAQNCGSPVAWGALEKVHDAILAATLARADALEAALKRTEANRDAAMEDAAEEYARAERAEALLAEAVEALRTLRDYIDDASRGTLRYRGQSDISEMAGQDLVFLDTTLTRIQETRHE